MHNILTFFRKIIRELTPNKPSFKDSSSYWEDRYRTGGKSGSGSYNELAEYKAEIINEFVRENNLKTVIEHGCGDGNQLTYGLYPSYTGFDVSPEAVNICKRKFKNDKSKTFKHSDEYAGETADITLSLDVIYHLVEDEVFQSYMLRLFESSKKFVLIYSSDFEEQQKTVMDHVKHRKFTKYVEKAFPGWKLLKKIPNRFPYSEDSAGSHSDFFIYINRK